jgi:hypothetical protein
MGGLREADTSSRALQAIPISRRRGDVATAVARRENGREIGGHLSRFVQLLCVAAVLLLADCAQPNGGSCSRHASRIGPLSLSL